MENSILEKEDKYIKDGYKQIYPNDKDIKVTLLNGFQIGYGFVALFKPENYH